MRKVSAAAIILAVATLFLFSCVGTITPKGTLAGMYKIYNDQYEDYQRMAENPATTEAQKQIMRKKKPILDKLGVLLPAYDAAIIQGTATQSQQQQITDLLNELGRM